MRGYAALLLVAVVSVACDSDSPTGLGDTPLELNTVVKASTSGLTTPVRTTVRASVDWADLWRTLHAGHGTVPALPPIDFDREMVVVAASGTRNNGCFAVEITAATRRGNGQAEFEVEETVPGPTCVCTQATTQPVHVARVVRAAGPESFVERRAELQC